MKFILRKYLYNKLARKIYSYLKQKKLQNFFIKILENPEYKNILIMDTIPYGTSFIQRPQQLLKFFVKDFDVVLYKLGGKDCFIQYKDNIILCPAIKFKKIKNKRIIYYIDSVNEYRNINDIKKIKKYGYKFVYDYIDEFSNKVFKTKKPFTIYKNLEKLKPDLIITTSDKMYSDMAERFPKEKIVMAKNGANPDDFINGITDFIPEDIKPVIQQGKPIIGYYGVISKWLDYKLLSKAAEIHKDYNFVFLGKDSQLSSQKLKVHKNVYFLGRKKYEELPNYAKFFDCCLIPFLKGNIAKATSPVKLFEYMALKKPVVCTRDLDECKGYEGCLISNDDEEFIKNISLAIEMSKDKIIQEKLLNYAKINSWEEKANSILNKMRNL